MISALRQILQKAQSILFQRSWRTLFLALSTIAIISMSFLSRHYGVTWDEWETTNNGFLAIRNILTWGKDMSLANVDFSYLYTHFFYTLVCSLYSFFWDPTWNIALTGWGKQTQHILPFLTFSHLINAWFGFMAMLYMGLFAKKMGGWRLASFALLLIILSPRFIGNSMNNTKDIPFAAIYIFSVYYMSFFLESLPQINIKAACLTAIGIGLCIGTRLGGAILVAYLLAFSMPILAYLTFTQKLPKGKCVKVLLVLFGMLIISALTCLVFWPYGRTHSLPDIFRAFLEMSNYHGWDHPVLFEGKNTLASQLPRYYIMKWIAISSPLFFSIGFIFSFLFWKKIKLTSSKINLLMLSVAGLFPLIFILIRSSKVYDSWRHFLFVYPPLVIFCAWGWDNLFQWIQQKKIRVAAIVTFFLLCSEPFLWMVKNPVDMATYFNPVAGGVRGAFTNYETDYWGNCLRESAEWLVDYHKKNYGEFPLALVLVDGTVMQTYPYLKKALGDYYRPFGYPPNFLEKAPYALYMFGANPPRNFPWNYGIFMSRNRSKEELEKNWPPVGTIHTVEAEGAPICAVVRNEQFYSTLLQKKKQ